MAERSALNLFDCKKTNRFIESRASEREFSVGTRQKTHVCKATVLRMRISRSNLAIFKI